MGERITSSMTSAKYCRLVMGARTPALIMETYLRAEPSRKEGNEMTLMISLSTRFLT